jgi:hypothetical protein
MQRTVVGAVLGVMLASACVPSVESPPQTIAAGKAGPAYGYRPLDPLTVSLNHPQGVPVTNCRILEILPDQTLRFAVGEVTESGSVSFGLAKAGFEGQRYVVIVDFMLSDTFSVPAVALAAPVPATTVAPPTAPAAAAPATTTPGTTAPATSSNAAADRYVPTYIGVGLRLTANLMVRKGEVDLGNLIAIGAAAEAKQVYGTLVIQTLGISGEGVASAIPIPSEISASSIQNALVAIGTIKGKIYDEKTSLSPRVVGIYDTFGNDTKGFDTFFAGVMRNPPVLNERINSNHCNP